MTIQVNGLFPGELLPNTTIAGCIDVFENVWQDPLDTILSIENECQNPESGFSWTRAETIGNGTNQNQRTNYDLGITLFAQETGNQLLQNIHNQMYVTLLAATIPYAEKHGISQMYHENYNMLRYRSSQEYKSHFDGETVTGRSISAIVYLNNEYSGGEIEFVNFGVKIKPEPGMLLLFPSNYAYRHIAHPVTDGTKYSIVTWIKDRNM